MELFKKGVGAILLTTAMMTSPSGETALANNTSSDSFWLNSSSSTTYSNFVAEEQALLNYSRVVARILELLESEEDDDEYGAVIPTDFALDRTLTILSNTYEILRTMFPVSVASVSPDGGVRVQWMHPSVSVRLVIPGSEGEKEYIFFEDEENYETEDVSAETLSKKLQWLQRVLKYAKPA